MEGRLGDIVTFLYIGAIASTSLLENQDVMGSPAEL